MRIYKYNLLQESVLGINIVETLRWVLFYFILDLIFPLLLDPLHLHGLFFGLELEDLIEFLIILVVPLVAIFYSDELSGYGCLHGLFLYFFLTTSPLVWIHFYFFLDSWNFIIILSLIVDILLQGDTETNHEGDLY